MFKSWEDIVEFVKKQFGVFYEWVGEDLIGFDCSGFIIYVLQYYGKKLLCCFEDQYNDFWKVKQCDVWKGDLVFFNNGFGVLYVGIIVFDKGELLVMIYVSLLKGVIIMEIEKLEYWLKCFYVFGLYVD